MIDFDAINQGFSHEAQVYDRTADANPIIRWARSLVPGSKVELAATPAIKAVVKNVTAQREKTQVRLVVRSFDLADRPSPNAPRRLETNRLRVMYARSRRCVRCGPLHRLRSLRLRQRQRWKTP